MKHIASFFTLFLVGTLITLGPVWGQEKNLGINKEVTARIRAFDREFFQGFVVYTAGTDEDNPSALLFDKKDDYHLPSRFWGEPLSEEEVVYAIRRLDDQYIDRRYDIPFEPQALNIVNRNGEVLGYCYTGLDYVLMDRKKDGQVTVFLPKPKLNDGGGYVTSP